MKEITRIHLAKVSYDVEVQAKKELEIYIKSLEAYTADQELLADIEIRMTELLAERGIVKNGVIGEADIKAIREQLGEPSDFMTDEAVDEVPAVPTDYQRRLYRDKEQSVLGGVLSGVSIYFGINPVWIRLVFIVLLLASFGTASIVYLVLWIVLPVARTAAEKLQLAGRPVTLQSIRELNESNDVATENRTPKVIQSILLVAGGIISSVGAIGVMIATITGGLLLYGEFDQRASVEPFFGTTLAGGVLWLAIISGLLLALLCSLLAYGLFARKVTKRMIISGVIVVALGLASFGTAIGVALTESYRQAELVQRDVETQTVRIKEATKVTSLELKIDKDNSSALRALAVEYIVDTEGSPRYTLTSLPGIEPEVVVDKTGLVVRVASEKTTEQYSAHAFYQSGAKLVIYGPALTSIDADSSLSYAAENQEALTITGHDDATVDVTGTYATLTAVSQDTAIIRLAESAVKTLHADVRGQGSVESGVVRNLSVQLADVCPVGDARARVIVSGVTAGEMSFNGQTMPSASRDLLCGSVHIDESEEGKHND